MKIRTNFVEPNAWLLPAMVGALALLAIIAAILSILLAIIGWQYRSEIPQLRERLVMVEAQAAPRPTNLPPTHRLVELRNQVRTLNMLTGQGGMPLPNLLGHLERLIPDDAWLNNLNYRSREGEAKLLITAGRAESLTLFMDKLEKSGHFNQVLLTRQVTTKNNTVQFEIQLKQNP